MTRNGIIPYIAAISLSIVLLSSTISQNVFALESSVATSSGLPTTSFLEQTLPAKLASFDFKKVSVTACKVVKY